MAAGIMAAGAMPLMPRQVNACCTMAAGRPALASRPQRSAGLLRGCWREQLACSPIARCWRVGCSNFDPHLLPAQLGAFDSFGTVPQVSAVCTDTHTKKQQLAAACTQKDLEASCAWKRIQPALEARATHAAARPHRCVNIITAQFSACAAQHIPRSK